MQPLNRLQIAWRAAQDVGDGLIVNLGIGMPVSVADYLRPEVDVFIQSENGVIGASRCARVRRSSIRPGRSP
jgi:3-oxoadipate CoA-transferase, beta subunit